MKSARSHSAFSSLKTRLQRQHRYLRGTSVCRHRGQSAAAPRVPLCSALESKRRELSIPSSFLASYRWIFQYPSLVPLRKCRSRVGISGFETLAFDTSAHRTDRMLPVHFIPRVPLQTRNATMRLSVITSRVSERKENRLKII